MPPVAPWLDHCKLCVIAYLQMVQRKLQHIYMVVDGKKYRYTAVYNPQDKCQNIYIRTWHVCFGWWGWFLTMAMIRGRDYTAVLRESLNEDQIGKVRIYMKCVI